MRKALIERKTKETKISLEMDLDGKGNYKISTGIAFFDHMLSLFCKQSLMDLKIKAKGDLEVDMHHLVEDTGIVLGSALKKALGSKEKIQRYGTSFVPMDEALSASFLDISGRGYLVFNCEYKKKTRSEFDIDLCEEFLRAFAYNSGITLHMTVMYGKNMHHIIESIFKALGRSLCDAVTKNPRIKGIPSTKGIL